MQRPHPRIQTGSLTWPYGAFGTHTVPEPDWEVSGIAAIRCFEAAGTPVILWTTAEANRALPSSAKARDLVRNREMQHKRGQARLANKKRLAEWTGDAGTSPIVFRWPQVQRMLTDLDDGLGGLEEDEHAVA